MKKLVIAILSICTISVSNAQEGRDASILSFVGAGDVQKTLSEGTEFAANTGVGVIYSRQWKRLDEKGIKRIIEFFELDFSINVASTVDSIKAEYVNGAIENQGRFGNYILLPTNSGQSAQVKMNTYFADRRIPLFPKLFKKKKVAPLFLTSIVSGVYAEFNMSNRVFSDSAVSKNATGMMFKAGLFHDFIPRDIGMSKGYSIKFGVAYSVRGIYGNAGFKNTVSNDFRKELLGTDVTNFSGWEVNLSLRLKNLYASVSVPNLFGDVPGLSQTQFITSIGFVGGFPVTLKLDKAKKKLKKTK